MSMSSIPKPSGSTANARTIDLFRAGIASDGTKIYAPAPEALGFQVGQRIGTLAAKYPRETLYGVTLASVAAVCISWIS